MPWLCQLVAMTDTELLAWIRGACVSGRAQSIREAASISPWLRRQAIESRRALDQALQTADAAQLAEAIADAHRMLGVSIAEPGAEEIP